jgi:hypothetical protein
VEKMKISNLGGPHAMKLVWWQSWYLLSHPESCGGSEAKKK